MNKSCLIDVILPKDSKYGESYQIFTELTFQEFINNVNKTNLVPREVNGKMKFIPDHAVESFKQVTEH